MKYVPAVATEAAGKALVWEADPVQSTAHGSSVYGRKVAGKIDWIADNLAIRVVAIEC